MEYSPVTFEQLLTDLRAGNVPNATQNEVLLALAEAVNKHQEQVETMRKAVELLVRIVNEKP